MDDLKIINVCIEEYPILTVLIILTQSPAPFDEGVRNSNYVFLNYHLND